jgi:hypothetical protein
MIVNLLMRFSGLFTRARRGVTYRRIMEIGVTLTVVYTLA